MVVGRCDLDRTGAEVTVHDRVGDDGHVPLDERDADAAPDERAIAIVVRVDGDRRVAEDRLRPRRRNGDRRSGIGLAGGLVDEVVADGPERARLGR